MAESRPCPHLCEWPKHLRMETKCRELDSIHSHSFCSKQNSLRRVEEEFIKSWTDTNEPYWAAADLDKLRMQHDNVDEYITQFAELARKALYHEDDTAVLAKFKLGLPLELLEPCVHHDDPQNWEAWTKSAHARQAILTALKAHQTNTTCHGSKGPWLEVSFPKF